MKQLARIKIDRVFKLWASLVVGLAFVVAGAYGSGDNTRNVKQNKAKLSLGKSLADEIGVNVDLVADDLSITHTTAGMIVENEDDGFIVQETPSGFRILDLDGEEIQYGQKASVLADLIGLAIIQGNVSYHADESEDDEPGVSCPEGECPYMGYCIDCDDDKGETGDPGETEDTGGDTSGGGCPRGCHDPNP